MKKIVDFILESRGQRISQRAGNRPYDPKNDKLLKKKESRPERAQELRETKLDKQVQEFCSSLVNDFMVKFYDLTKSNSSLVSFSGPLTRVFKKLEKDNDIDGINPKTDRKSDGCVFLHVVETDDDDGKTYNDYILQYKTSDSFTNILKNLDFHYIHYSNNGWSSKDINDEGDTKVYINYKPKFFASVLRRLRRHDLAEKADEGTKMIDLFELFNDVADNYNKNYFVDKFKEIESAYNEVLANW